MPLFHRPAGQVFPILFAIERSRARNPAAINKISAITKARELNRAVLVEPSAAREYYETSLAGLLEWGTWNTVRDFHLLRAAPR